MPYKGDDYVMGYTYDKKTKRYLRSMPWGPHVMADGTRISVDNVLVIKAKQHFGKIYKGGGHDEPLHDIINTQGKFYYANRGRYVTGTWRRAAVAEPFEFTLADGTPLKMATGRRSSSCPTTAPRCASPTDECGPAWVATARQCRRHPAPLESCGVR